MASLFGNMPYNSLEHYARLSRALDEGTQSNALEQYARIAKALNDPLYCNALASKKTTTRYRDAVDGEFITKREAEARPRESVKEQIPLPKKPRAK